MTDEEAKRNLVYAKRWNDRPTMETIDHVIQVLEQQPCEDCVKREDVKRGMIKYGFLAPDMTVTEFVEDLPSATPLTDVLDKIRAEIEFEVDHRTNMLCAEDVFEIIDKYKAESEE